MSTILSPRNDTATIKREPDLFRDFKIEVVNKIVDPLPQKLEAEIDVENPDLKTIQTIEHED